MDEIIEYLMFMPTHARGLDARDCGTPATPASGSTGAAPRSGDPATPEAVRRLLAEPKVLAALLRLAGG